MIDKIPGILIFNLWQKRKKGKIINITTARLLVFHWKPVGTFETF